MSIVKVAAVQMRSGTSPERNAADFEKLVREAASKGAQYVQTPEMTGALVRGKDELKAILKPEAEDLIARKGAELAKELGIYLHVGSTAIARDDGKVANRGFIFAPSGEKIASYDKIHMFDVEIPDGQSYRESATFRPGEEAVTADLPWGKLGLSICYDMRFPYLYRSLAHAGASFLAVPAAFTEFTGRAHWHVLLRARAIETGCFVFAPAQCGTHVADRRTYGHSLVVAPWGEVLADAGEEPGVITAHIDPARVTEARRMVPALSHDKPLKVAEVAPA